MRMKRRLTIAVVVLTVALTLPQMVWAQFYYGKNKVQYTDFEWMVLATERFDIYFYESERELAELAAKAAEESYDILADRFNHQVVRRIPLIIYSSPNFFSETNVVSSLLPENVGGFTEFLKGRVVLPFNGSWYEFHRVLQHELVHVFTMSKLSSVTKAHRKLTSASPPLWFTEGLAEFYSGEWDSDGDMVMSDLVLTGRLSNLNGMNAIYGSYLMYKAGESFFHFIEEEYGTEYILRIFDNWWRGGNFEEIMEVTFEKPLEVIGVEWGYWLKKKYFPTIEDRELPDQMADRITKSGYNVKPVPVRIPAGDTTEEWIAFKANRLGYAGLYMTRMANGERKTETLLRGERTSEFESLHLLNSGLDVTPDGRIVFSSKSHDRDVIYVLDAKTRKVVDEHVFDSLYVVASPSYSPDGKLVAFTGCHKDGIHDLFLYDLERRTLRQLTKDIYYDADPVFTPDGKGLVFASDRGRYGDEGYMNLYQYRLTNGHTGSLAERDRADDPFYSPMTPPPGEPDVVLADGAGEYSLISRVDDKAWMTAAARIEVITEGRHNDRSPTFDPGTHDLLYSSDRDGRYNIYRRTREGRLDRLTNLATAAFDPRVLPDGDGFVFTAYQSTGFQIYRMPFPRNDSLVVVEAPDSTYLLASVSAGTDTACHSSWQPMRGAGDMTRTAIKYQNRFSFDIAQSAVAFDAFYGTIGGFQTALTDVLGNHQYFFLVANNADSKDEFFQSFNVAVNYINREHRINYGYGAYHLFDEYDDPLEGPLRERQYGVAGYAGYPLSKFRRIETSLFLRQSKREELFGGPTREALLATQFIGIVQDNSLWDISGPIDGHRILLSLGFTADLSEFQSFNRIAIVDARKYFRLGRYSAFATRLLGHFSSGHEPQRRYLGGSWDLRGYSRRGFYARNVVLSSNELRFPLIDALFVGSPVASLGFNAIRGALFFDAGNAWEDDFGRMKGSMGVGARVALGYFAVLRFDWARRTDFRTIDDKTNFEFFFGWNF